MKQTAPHQRRTIRSPPGPVARQNDPNGSAVVKEEALHIFVVDDEKVISETLAAILRLSGFAATSFTNPFEALNARSGSPDLLLSDVVMPGPVSYTHLDVYKRQIQACGNSARPVSLTCTAL